MMFEKVKCSNMSEVKKTIGLSQQSIELQEKIESLSSSNDSKTPLSEQIHLNSAQSINPFGPAIGPIKALFSCTYLGRKGDLYVATKAICFRHTLVFGFELGREIIPWHSVRSISEKYHGNSQKGVSITTSGQENFELRNLSASVNESIQLFRMLWKNELLVRRSRLQQRHPSDPLSQVLSFKGLIFEEVIPDEGIEDDKQSEVAERNACMQSKSIDADRIKLRAMQKNDKKEHGGDAQAWKEVQGSKETVFSETPVTALHLDCNIDEFFNRCLADNAPLSVVTYHRNETGDYDVLSKPWKLEEDCVSYKRTIAYTHPVEIRMAPPKAEVLKVQIMRRYGDYGISISTTTLTKGVPVSDCFHIEDRILVESQLDDGVSISIAFDLRFVKYTLLRRIVECTTKKDVNEFHRTYIDFLKRGLIATKDTIVEKNATQALCDITLQVQKDLDDDYNMVQMHYKEQKSQWTVIIFIALLFLLKCMRVIISLLVTESRLESTSINEILIYVDCSFVAMQGYYL